MIEIQGNKSVFEGPPDVLIPLVWRRAQQPSDTTFDETSSFRVIFRASILIAIVFACDGFEY
jgi:hypothetical protein